MLARQPKSSSQRLLGAVIIAPAWEASGSWEVFNGQLRTLSYLGYDTYLLTAPHYWMSRSEYERRCQENRRWTTDAASTERGEMVYPRWNWLAQWRFASEAAEKTEAFKATRCAQVMQLPPSLLRFVRKKRELFVLCNHFFNIPIVEQLRKAVGMQLRFALETHDIQSRHYLKRLGQQPNSAYDDMLAEEMSFASKADILIHISDEELPVYKNALPQHDHRLVYPALANRSKNFSRQCENTFLIVAAWNDPNADSVEWFLNNVWARYSGGGTLRIVGDIAGLMRLRHPETFSRWQHIFVGRIADVAVAYNCSAVVVLPTIAGEGISIKFAEAIAYGRRVLFTPRAVRGLPSHATKMLSGRCENAEDLLAKMMDVDPCALVEKDIDSCAAFELLFTQSHHLDTYTKIVNSLTNNLDRPWYSAFQTRRLEID